MPTADLRAQGDSSSLVAALRVLRERWWLVALAFVACVAASYALSKSATVQYEASAQLLIGQQSNLGAVIDPNAPQQGSSDPERDQATALLLLTSSTVADRVKKVTGDPAPAASLASGVVASAEADANLITVTATDPRPERAQRLADAFAQQYVDLRRENARRGVSEGEAELRRQRDALTPENVAQRETINTALEKIVAIRALIQGDAQVASRAGLPTSPSSPRTKRDLVLAAVLGLVLGVALAFLLDLFDRRLKTVDDFERAFGMRSLAAVPQRQRSRNTERDRAVALEPFRILSNGLGLLSSSDPVRILLVTSSVQGEGKSTTAIGLARAAAHSGQRVVLVEADLRRPTFHQHFDLGDQRRGLSSNLMRDGIDPDDLAWPSNEPPTLAVLPAGPISLQSADLLRRPAMARTLVRLLADADLVILDAPPLLPVADAQILLANPSIDAAVVVGRAFRTSRDEARRSRAVLEQHTETSFALVVNGVRDAEAVYEYRVSDRAAKRRRPFSRA